MISLVHVFKKFSLVIISILCLMVVSCNRNLDITDGTTSVLDPPHYLVVGSSRDGTVLLKWNKSNSQIEGYNIYMSSTGSYGVYEKTGTTYEEYYYIKNLAYDISYYFQVKSYNGFQESGASNSVNAKPVNINSPSIPTGFSVLANYTQNMKTMNLSWYPNTEGDILKYNIYRTDGYGFFLINETTFNNYNDTDGLDIGKRYYYRITAVDKGGLESQLSSVESDFILNRPELISPKNSELISKYPAFSWKAVEGASGYIVFLSTAINGNEIWSFTIDNNDLDEYTCQLNANVLVFGKQFYWKVFTIGKSFNYPNSCSETRSFYFYPEN